MNSAQLLQQTTVTATGRAVQPAATKRTFQATVIGTGAVTAEVDIYGSNHEPVAGVGQHGVLLGTITLSGTTSDTDGFVADTPWLWVWPDVTAISGTGAETTVRMGV
jgi:hypothetical protein